mmetsp:Transcript_14853/g.22601  ORF Transcript_14853/g.22601 Transcript_14853/m.22601 type:complete len:208 (+) Transcript_14853:115-738(+)
MTTTCTLHCMNTKMAQEWLRTCDEYANYVKKPFSSVGPAQIWKCHQANWGDAYKEWGVLQFWVGLVVASVIAVVRVIDGKDFVKAATDLSVRILIAYLLAHFSWFAVVKKKGCFCCFIACCECPPILLVWGVLNMAWGMLGVVDSLRDMGHGPFLYVLPALQAVYSIILFYSGLCCFKIWTQNGSDISKPFLQVKGPEGEQVAGSKV